ncbi:MAG: GTPase ObgE, partial [Caldisericaceae bacterium]
MIKTPKKSLIDHAYITVRSGNGGDGAVSFRREKFVPRGGPDGGSGGKGGSVFIKATSSLNTLSNFIYRKHFFAKNGENGGSRNKAGRDAEDIEILVPVGTTVIDRDSGLLIKDLDKDGESAIVAKGGKGGKGNKSFATSRDQAPRYSEKGEPGEEKQLELVLKILSDVGVIGAPNAGKSTLLSQVSNAKPTIANYPFTTLSPKIGTVKLEDGSSFVIADLPGLIEGASAGKGMGVEFLSHVERTKLLLLLIDGSDRKAIRATYEMLLSELEAFKSELLYKPRVVVINKIDTWKVKRTKEIENFFEDR